MRQPGDAFTETACTVCGVDFSACPHSLPAALHEGRLLRERVTAAEAQLEAVTKQRDTLAGIHEDYTAYLDMTIDLAGKLGLRDPELIPFDEFKPRYRAAVEAVIKQRDGLRELLEGEHSSAMYQYGLSPGEPAAWAKHAKGCDTCRALQAIDAENKGGTNHG